MPANLNRNAFAELHLHLGGAILPRILYSYMEREYQAAPESAFGQVAKHLLEAFPEYEVFEKRLTRASSSLAEYLETHKIIEPLQQVEALPYLVYRLLRGAYVFENIAYLELRHNPFFRIPDGTPLSLAKERMGAVVSTIHQAAQHAKGIFPIQFSQILCMDSRLPDETNRLIMEVAQDQPEAVCAVDLAGPNEPYDSRRKEFAKLFEDAKSKGLRTTAHVFETALGTLPELLPFLDRIGHGIEIALNHRHLLVGVASRNQCLEICPSTYVRTGTLKSYKELKPVFERCFNLGVDIAICTDNMALNDVRLPREHELLLLNRVLSFAEMERCRQAAFRHGFRYVTE